MYDVVLVGTSLTHNGSGSFATVFVYWAGIRRAAEQMGRRRAGGGAPAVVRKSHVNMRTTETLFDAMYEGKEPEKPDPCCCAVWQPPRWLDQGAFTRKYSVDLTAHLSEQQFDEYHARLNLATAPHRSTLVDDDINSPSCKLGYGMGLLFLAHASLLLWPVSVCLCCSAHSEYKGRFVPKHGHLIARVQGTVDIINADLASRDQPLRYEMYHDNIAMTSICNSKRNVEPVNSFHEDNCCHGKIMAGVRVQFTGARPIAPSIHVMGGEPAPPGGFCDVCQREVHVNNMASHVAGKKHRAAADKAGSSANGAPGPLPYGYPVAAQASHSTAANQQPMTYTQQQQQQQHAAPAGRVPQQQPVAPVGRMPPPRQQHPNPEQRLPGQVHGSFCTSCGKQASDSAAFCDGCNARLYVDGGRSSAP
jgi:hypothetical protein